MDGKLCTGEKDNLRQTFCFVLVFLHVSIRQCGLALVLLFDSTMEIILDHDGRIPRK